MLNNIQVLNISKDNNKFVSANKTTQLNDTNVHFKKKSKTLKYFDVFFDRETSLKMTTSFSANCN